MSSSTYDNAFAQLQRDVEELKQQVALLESLIDVEELRAADRIAARGLTNERLRAWAAHPIVPPGIEKTQEERPW